MNEKSGGVEIDVLKLLQALLKKWWLILLATVIGAAIALAYTIGFVTPMYQASAMLYVNNSTFSVGDIKSITSGDITGARTLVSTYRVILNTRLTLEAVAEKIYETTGTKYSYGALSGMISSASVNDTEVLRITVTNSSPEMAMIIANTVAEVLPQKIPEVIVGCSVKTVDLAVTPTSRSSPSYSRNTVIGALIGAVICCGILALVFIFDDTISDENWLLESFKDEIPLLSIIPSTSERRGGYYRNKNYGYGYGYGQRGYNKYGYGYGYYKQNTGKTENNTAANEPKNNGASSGENV